MLKAYRNLGYFFIFLFVVILAGFYKTYIGLVPQFKGIPFFAHIHFTAFVLWFALLIIQPFLIRNKKFKLHRLLGYASCFLIPVLVYTTSEMQKFGYRKDLLKYPKAECLAGMINTYLDIGFFVLFYIIAMLNRKKLAIHICFMVGTSIILLSPGLGRLLFHTLGGGLMVELSTFGIQHLIVMGFMVFEKVKLQRSIWRSPYLLLFGLLLAEHILYFQIPDTAAWQWLAEKIVTYTY